MVHPFCDLGRQRKIADRGSEETDQYIAKLTGVRGPRPKLRAGQAYAALAFSARRRSSALKIGGWHAEPEQSTAKGFPERS